MQFDFYAWVRQTEQRLHALEARLQGMERQYEELRHTLLTIKPVHIDAINYKVQELAVRDLSGTLNIGLTALSNPKQLEEWLQQQTAAEADSDVKLENMQQATGMEEANT